MGAFNHIYSMQASDYIAILDFGSQYTHLIARRIRELGVSSRIFPAQARIEDFSSAIGLILSGGPRPVTSSEAPEHDSRIFSLDIPILGHCYGHQLIGHHFGSTVTTGGGREYGIATFQTSSHPLFSGIPTKTTVWMSHGYHVENLPEGFSQIGSTESESIAAIADDSRKIYGFQFHPEVHHSEHGMQMLSNFVFTICGATKNWTSEIQLQHIQDQIREEAKDKNVFLLVSGGVDSTVCFALLEKTLGKERVYGLHIDHGFMRLDESEKVSRALEDIGLDDLHVIDAQQEYLSTLDGISDPEKKRTIIGDTFLDIVERVMKKLGFEQDSWLLGQGTIYPDTIESGGTQHADKIKTHHNRVDRVQDMIEKGLIIEPIKDLYKDEVRTIGRQLGLPHELIDRHPFPGPGLAIRILCSEGEKEAPHIADDDLIKLPIKSVGVQGDERSYSHPALLTQSPITWDDLSIISAQITNTHTDINRVLVCPFADSAELKSRILESTVKKAYLSKDRIDLLKQIDDIVNRHIDVPDCNHIWQMPVVLVPFGHKHRESIVLRPVESKEAMTVSWARLPENILRAIYADIEALDKIDFIFYDITNKPPGTIEWE